MDYLRTLGSAAVSTLVAKSGLNLPFTLGPKASSFGDTTPWILYEGTKRVRIPPLFFLPAKRAHDNIRTMVAQYLFLSLTQTLLANAQCYR
jgi:hypothetical protein